MLFGLIGWCELVHACVPQAATCSRNAGRGVSHSGLSAATAHGKPSLGVGYGLACEICKISRSCESIFPRFTLCACVWTHSGSTNQSCRSTSCSHGRVAVMTSERGSLNIAAPHDVSIAAAPLTVVCFVCMAWKWKSIDLASVISDPRSVFHWKNIQTEAFLNREMFSLFLYQLAPLVVAMWH